MLLLDGENGHLDSFELPLRRKNLGKRCRRPLKSSFHPPVEACPARRNAVTSCK
jgi:hypothetical protein